MKFKNVGRIVIILLLIFGAATVSIFLFLKSNKDLDIISPLSRSFSILSFTGTRNPPDKIVYGYLPYWTINEAKHFQMDKLTDIAYFGLHIDENGDFLKVVDGENVPGWNNWRNNEDLDEIIKKAKKNGVRFALTVVAHHDETTDKFLDCRECWDRLAANVVRELLEKDIQDVNLNFEYVEYTPRETALKFTEFTDFMNQKLDLTFGESNVVVSAFADSAVKERVSEIESLGKVADGIFIMGYDFHRPSSATAGPVAPIGGKGVHAEYDIETMLIDYLTVVPPNKLILGVPYYGYNWVVESEEEYAKRIEGTDDIGFSKSQTYEQIMETILTVKPELKWDELAKTPYFSYESPETGSLREVYFDNAESLSFKYDLVLRHNMAGIGIWALGYDGGYNDLWNLIDRFFIN